MQAGWWHWPHRTSRSTLILDQYAAAYNPANIPNMAAQRRMQAAIWGVGDVRFVQSGEIEVPDHEAGLTRCLGRDRFGLG